MNLQNEDEASSEPAMLRASWLIVEDDSITTTTRAATATSTSTSTMSNGQQKRSAALEDGLKQRRAAVVEREDKDNVNDKVSPADGDGEERTGASTQPKNWSAEEMKHIAKSDTCLTTTSHLGQV